MVAATANMLPYKRLVCYLHIILSYLKAPCLEVPPGVLFWHDPIEREQWDSM